MIGIFSALGASISWTYACFIWRTQANIYKALDINFIKNIFAFIIFAPALISFDLFSEYKYLIILLISGIIGIALGDTFYLKSLKLIGTRKTLSIEALSPLIAASSSMLFINESLGIHSWIGIIIVCTSLISIIKKRVNLVDKNSNLIPSFVNFGNYIYSFLSVICAVSAALLSRLVFLESEFKPIHTTEIRLLGAIIFLTVITKLKINFFIPELNKTEKIRFIISILFGTNIGILLQQIVFKTLPIGIGWTFLSTSPVISLFLSKKEEGKISKDIIISTISLCVGLTLVIL